MSCVEDFYRLDREKGKVGIYGNAALVVLIFICSVTNVWGELYIPKVMNYPWASTCLTIGTYFSICMRRSSAIMPLLTCFSFVAFLTNAFYLNELVNTSVTILQKYEGSYKFAIINPVKHFTLVSHNQTVLGAEVGFYTFEIVVVSMAMVFNFVHLVSSFVYLNKFNADNKYNLNNFYPMCCDGEPNEYRRAGSYMGVFIIIIIVYQATASWILLFMSVMLLSPFPDIFSTLAVFAFMALNPPLPEHAINDNSHWSHHGPGLVFGGGEEKKEEREKNEDKSYKILVRERTVVYENGVTSCHFYCYFVALGFIVLVSCINFALEIDWRVSNDISAFCESNVTKIYGQRIEYFYQNTGYKQDIQLNLLSGQIGNATMGYNCVEDILELFLIILIIGIFITHATLIKCSHVVRYMRLHN